MKNLSILISAFAMLLLSAYSLVAQGTLRDELSDENCPAACFMGIVPGITSKASLENILNAASISFDSATVGLAQGFPTPTVFAVEWSPDGTALAIAGTDGLRVRNTETNEDLPGFQSTSLPVYTVAWSPGGSRLVSSGESGQIDIWNVSDGRLITSLIGHEGRIAAMRWSPDGTKLASASTSLVEDFSLRIWDMVNNFEFERIQAGPVADVVWLGNNSQVVVAHTGLGAFLYDLPLDLATRQDIGPSGPVFSLAASPDGSKLAIASFDNAISVWDMSTNTALTWLVGHTDIPLSLSWNPARDVLASASRDGTVRTWDLSTGQAIHVINVGATLSAVNWSPDGSKLVYGGETLDGHTETLKILHFPTANAGPDRTMTDNNSFKLVTPADTSASD